MARFPEAADPFVGEEALPEEASPGRAAALASRLPLAGAIVLAVVAEGFLGLALALSDAVHLSLVEVAVPIISGLFALGGCLLAGTVLSGRERGAWMLLGFSCLGVLVAQAAQLVPLPPGSLPIALAGAYPSVASLALIVQSIGLFLAFLLFPPPMRERGMLRRLRFFFDGVLVLGSALVGALYFILVPLFQAMAGFGSAARLTVLAICVADLFLLAGVVFTLRSAGERSIRPGGALRLLALGALLLIGADAASLIQWPGQPAPMTSWLQAVWNAGYLCLGLGAMLRLRAESQVRAASTDDSPEEAERPALWMVLPFALTATIAGAIALHALALAVDPIQRLAALVCVSLLVILTGARHLVGLFETRQMSLDSLLLARELAAAMQEIDQLQATRHAQAQRRQESLARLQEVLMRFSSGEYQMRALVTDGELVPLAEHLNALLESFEWQRYDRDRARELRLLRVLADALGRLALGELNDLPSLPPPTGSGELDTLIRGVVQMRTRLLGLHQALQQHEAVRRDLEQQLAEARKQWEEEARARQQETLQMNQAVEARLQTEIQVVQADRERLQRELQRVQVRLQAAEEQALAAEAALKALEEQMHRERLELEQERQKLGEQLRAERQALEEQVRQVSQPGPALIERLRKQSEQLIGVFTSQAERFYTSAASLQTAAEVAGRLVQTLEETAALPDLQGQPQAGAGASIPQETPKQRSALEMLEKLAGLRPEETAPQPAIPPGQAQTTGPLGEMPGERVARRVRAAAGRADEIARGLLELAQQFIAASEETSRAVEEAGKLADELKQSSAVPVSIPRTAAPRPASGSGQ